MKLEKFDTQICSNCFEQGHERSTCALTYEELLIVGKAAAFIGARLNYVLPKCNGGKHCGKPISTINVIQHKEKFFWARVYCRLADPKLVLEKWQSEHPELNDVKEPPRDFRDKCFRLDAWHYRTCYLDMLSIVPAKLKPRIKDQADYSELLFDNENELCAHLDEIEIKNPDDITFYCKKYEVETSEQLKERLVSFYKQPSLSEWIGDL
jgi:hypothetical protein